LAALIRRRKRHWMKPLKLAMTRRPARSLRT
jgi:hypothetical protein